MTGRIHQGWALLRQSWSVVRLDKKLLIFPVLSALACMVVVASFALPFVLDPAMLDRLFAEEESGRSFLGYVLLFLFYLASYFVVIFFNTALISCAITRFRGDEPSVGGGLRSAASLLPQIFGWALVSATVGMILRAIEERSQLLGRIVVSLVGLAWAVVTYFVLPVLVVERVGPVAAVKRSAAILRQTWGEALVGQFSLGFLNFILALPGIVLFSVGVALGSMGHSLGLAILCGAVGVIYLVVLAIVISTLQQVFLAAVYLHASERVVPLGFTEDALRSAFRPKS